jgi:hypothetical protein
MTRCILPTDIELAKKLLTAKRPNNTIVAALVHRGIDSVGAAQLVADLREGRQVTPEIPPGLEISTRRRSRSRRTSSQGDAQPSGAAEPQSHSEPVAERSSEHHRKSASTFWLLGAVPVCFAAVIIGVLISNHLHRTGDDAETGTSPAASASGTAASAAANPKAPHAGTVTQATAQPGASATPQPPPASATNAPSHREQ